MLQTAAAARYFCHPLQLSDCAAAKPSRMPEQQVHAARIHKTCRVPDSTAEKPTVIQKGKQQERADMLLLTAPLQGNPAAVPSRNNQRIAPRETVIPPSCSHRTGLKQTHFPSGICPEVFCPCRDMCRQGVIKTM